MLGFEYRYTVYTLKNLSISIFNNSKYFDMAYVPLICINCILSSLIINKILSNEKNDFL